MNFKLFLLVSRSIHSILLIFSANLTIFCIFATMKVTFLHPDFGIGGAERLVLDAAIALRNKGHRVHIVTNYFSRDHCFPELLSFEGGRRRL